MATSTNGITTPEAGVSNAIPVHMATMAASIDTAYGLTVADVATLEALTDNLFKGRRVFVDDIDTVATYNGSSWDGYWKDYSPSLGWSNTAATSAKWLRVGKLVHVEVLLTLSGTPSGTFTVSLPSTAGSTANRYGIGTALLIDGASDATRRSGTVILASTTTATLLVDSSTSNAVITASVPWTWASTDTVGMTFTYREA